MTIPNGSIPLNRVTQALTLSRSGSKLLPDTWLLILLGPLATVILFFFLIDGRLLFFLIYLFYLFLAALGLCCCVRAFSTCGERGLLFVVVRELLIAVASLVAEHGL